MTHVEIALAAPITRTLTYSLPTDSAEGAVDKWDRVVGRRVLVPLAGRRVTGYVLSVGDAQKTEYKVRNIVRFLDDNPLFHKNQIPFFRWVAAYYHYPLGLVVKAALPGGLAPKSVKKIVLCQNSHELAEVLDDNCAEWLKTLQDKGSLSVTNSQKVLAARQNKKQITKLVAAGIIKIEESLQKDATREKHEVCYRIAADSGNFTVNDDGDCVDFNKYRQRYSQGCGHELKLSETKALYHLNSIGKRTRLNDIPLRDLTKEYTGAAKALKSLETKELVSCSSHRVYRNPFGQQLAFYPRPKTLTSEQSSALKKISGALAKQKFMPFLLHGVTGCGKTEVYLRAAEITLAAGRDVLILVPEIALATQLEAHLVSRFGDLVVLQHSGMTKAERFDQYHKALTGQARVVVGARSALFTPLRDPGLIVVDEEHDAGFKQDDNFRYHGRDIAVVRAKNHDAVIILGSATPSVTSFANAKSGKYTLLTMAKRVGDRPLPKVKIVDLSKDNTRKKRKIIRSELEKKLKDNLAGGRQSVLLMNRRGFSTAFICQDCGTPVQCTHCNVSLTLHKKTDRLLCHYCGFSISAKTVCFECRSIKLVPAGFGIEKVEEEVCGLLPTARVKRLDSDTAADRKKFLAILAEMHSGTIDILIGTQMIAKGLHFPNVTLVGVVWADGGLSMPDFRAAEKTFQLITQVTGRAGRGDLEGEVIIQTMRPEHYAIVYAKNHQYEDMFEHEMQLRASPSFPPYVRLTAIRLKGKVEMQTRNAAMKIGRFFRKYIIDHKSGVTVLGPSPSPLDKIKDNYRWQILLKGSSNDELGKVCRALEAEKSRLVHRNCKLTIDVDPENMM